MASGQGIAMAQPIVNQASVPVAYEKEVAMKNAALQADKDALNQAAMKSQMENEMKMEEERQEKLRNAQMMNDAENNYIRTVGADEYIKNLNRTNAIQLDEYLHKLSPEELTKYYENKRREEEIGRGLEMQARAENNYNNEMMGFRFD
jgi:hypothetical protein